MNTIINSINDCIGLGMEISQKLKSGNILILEGELGSGKTTFVKGILKGLNYKYEVTSPTFTLINEYNADHKVIHIDFYREKNILRWKNIGIEEYLYNDNIVIIEWGNLIPELIPENSINIYFEHLELNKRKISYSNEFFSN